MIFQLNDASGVMALDVGEGLRADRYGNVLKICGTTPLHIQDRLTRAVDTPYLVETDGFIVGNVTAGGAPPGLKGVRIFVDGRTPPLTVWQEVSSTVPGTHGFCCPVPYGFTFMVARIQGSEVVTASWVPWARPRR